MNCFHWRLWLNTLWRNQFKMPFLSIKDDPCSIAPEQNISLSAVTFLAVGLISNEYLFVSRIETQIVTAITWVRVDRFQSIDFDHLVALSRWIGIKRVFYIPWLILNFWWDPFLRPLILAHYFSILASAELVKKCLTIVWVAHAHVCFGCFRGLISALLQWQTYIVARWSACKTDHSAHLLEIREASCELELNRVRLILALAHSVKHFIWLSGELAHSFRVLLASRRLLASQRKCSKVDAMLVSLIQWSFLLPL